jgi:putative cardiolipin synthase
MGIFIESAEIGEEFTRRVMEVIPEVAYRVDLDGKGSLSWTYAFSGEREVWNKEPQTSWGRRFKAGFYRIMPIENQL